MILFSVHGSPWMCRIVSDMAKTLTTLSHQVVIAAWDEYALAEFGQLGHANVLDMINLYRRHDYPEPEREQVREMLKFDWTGDKDRPLGMTVDYEESTIRRSSQAWASCQFVLDMFKPKALVIWNNLSFGGRLFAMLADAGASRFYIERGPLPNTIQFSMRGVNADLITAKSVARPDDRSVRIATEWVENYKAKKDLPWPELEITRMKAPDEVATIKKPIMMFVAQVAYDTQIVHHSSLGYNYPRIYDLLRRVWDVSSAYQLVIKLHPFIHMPHLHQKAHEIPGAIVVGGGDIRDYLALPQMHRVFAVNSSVGFESMLYGLSTVTIGRNWYTPLTSVNEEYLREWIHTYTEKQADNTPWPGAIYRMASGIQIGEFCADGTQHCDWIAHAARNGGNVDPDSICKALAIGG
jgi:hypothetical protein